MAGETEDSVTVWIASLKAGEADAAQQLWQRYFEALVRLARDRLRGAPRTVADYEEDAALSAPSTASSAGPPADVIPGSMTAMTFGGCWWSSPSARPSTRAHRERRPRKRGERAESGTHSRCGRLPLLLQGELVYLARHRADARVRRAGGRRGAASSLGVLPR